jgi:hypothetical protein
LVLADLRSAPNFSEAGLAARRHVILSFSVMLVFGFAAWAIRQKTLVGGSSSE